MKINTKKTFAALLIAGTGAACATGSDTSGTSGFTSASVDASASSGAGSGVSGSGTSSGVGSGYSSGGSSASSSSGSSASSSSGSSASSSSGGSSASSSSGGSSASSSSGGSSASSSGGTEASASAPTFGGVFATGGKTCPATNCYSQNPAAASACACPSGFTASMPINFVDNRSCPSNNPPYGWTALNVCYAGPFTATSDFGGFYQHQGSTCSVANPMAANSCACPSGSQAIELVIDGPCYVNQNVDFCYNPSATIVSFGGAYQVSDNTSYGTNGCVVNNPLTSACSCPANTTAVAIENEYGPSTSGCSNNGISAGHLYVCVAP